MYIVVFTGRLSAGKSHVYCHLHGATVCGAKVMFIVVFRGRLSAGRKLCILSSSRGECLRGESHVYCRLHGVIV